MTMCDEVILLTVRRGEDEEQAYFGVPVEESTTLPLSQAILVQEGDPDPSTVVLLNGGINGEEDDNNNNNNNNNTNLVARSQSLDNNHPGGVFIGGRSMTASYQGPDHRLSIGAAATDTDTGEMKLDDDDSYVVNHTLKVLILGAPKSGRSSLVQSLRAGGSSSSFIPAISTSKSDAASTRSVGVNIQELNLNEVSFSLWDFHGGNHHSIHELFYTCRSLFVITWDLSVHNLDVISATSSSFDFRDKDYDALASSRNAFRLNNSDSEDEDEEDNRTVVTNMNMNASDRDLIINRDLDTDVQYWIESIQSSCPGAVIVPVCTFADKLPKEEVKRRAKLLKRRLIFHEERFNRKLERSSSLSIEDSNRDHSMNSIPRPKFVFPCDEIVCISNTNGQGILDLRQSLVDIAIGGETCNEPYFKGHVGAFIPHHWITIRQLVTELRGKYKVITWLHFMGCLKLRLLSSEKHVSTEDVIDALHFFSSTGELCFFGSTDPKDKEFLDYIILNPRWLIAAIACIVRDDLSQKMIELKGSKESDFLPRKVANNLNCPVITSNQIKCLFRSEKLINKARLRIEETLVQGKVSLFTFLQRLFSKCNILIFITMPELVNRQNENRYKKESSAIKPVLSALPADENSVDDMPRLFFVPSLLYESSHDEHWSYKCLESYKTTLCNSFLVLEGGVPPGFMEHFIGVALRDITSINSCIDSNTDDRRLKAFEIHGGTRSLYIRLGLQQDGNEQGDLVSNIVEIFAHLARRDSPKCVSSSQMGVDMWRLIISAKGVVRDDLGKVIWSGGFGLILQSVKETFAYYPSLLYREEITCPTCLAHYSISDARSWDKGVVYEALERNENTVTCGKGHRLAAHLLLGVSINNELPSTWKNDNNTNSSDSRISPVPMDNQVFLRPLKELFEAVVLIGLFDAEDNLRGVGSGFISNGKKGIITTAAHVVVETSTGSDFGKLYYGIEDAKIKIGINQLNRNAQWMYRATILDTYPAKADSCTLKIITKLEDDYERILRKKDIRSLKLPELAVCQKLPEQEEMIRVVGHNQDRYKDDPTSNKTKLQLNHSLDYTQGYCCQIWRQPSTTSLDVDKSNYCNPREMNPECEIIAIMPTISGHSGAPCVNAEGEVIGVLSRADPVGHRCYITPSSSFPVPTSTGFSE